MQEFVASHESTIRLAAFASLFALFALTEIFRPRRRLRVSKTNRWFTNIAIVIIDSALVRLLFPAAAVGLALWAQTQGIGLFNVVEVPIWIAALVSIVVLDFAVWLSHVLSHKVPLFWRFHRMHHSDRDFDVTTAIRFHPIEIIVSMGWKVAWVLILGAPAFAVIIFEILLNGTAMFNHSNTKLPLWGDRILRWVVVTPDMHRVHHSVHMVETDSNYGFNLPWWDRLFGTYVDQPRDGHEEMKIGLQEWQDDRPVGLGWSLRVPFLGSDPRR